MPESSETAYDARSAYAMPLTAVKGTMGSISIFYGDTLGDTALSGVAALHQPGVDTIHCCLASALTCTTKCQDSIHPVM